MDRTISSPPARALGLQYLSLFSSLGTLICCALPSLLVLFGLGATVASILSTAPWLVALSHHRNWVFGIAGALIAGNFVYLYAIVPRLRSAAQVCPPGDPSCRTATRVSKVVLWLSAGIYTVGAITAFALGPFFLWWDARH
jgi:mercuric ion transport protein